MKEIKTYASPFREGRGRVGNSTKDGESPAHVLKEGDGSILRTVRSDREATGEALEARKRKKEAKREVKGRSRGGQREANRARGRERGRERGRGRGRERGRGRGRERGRGRGRLTFLTRSRRANKAPLCINRSLHAGLWLAMVPKRTTTCSTTWMGWVRRKKRRKKRRRGGREGWFLKGRPLVRPPGRGG
jgi:hypothetical protein